MTRKEIIEGTNEILTAIQSTDIIQAITNSLRQWGSRSGPSKAGEIDVVLLHSLQQWLITAHQLSAAAQNISTIMGLDSLSNPIFTAKLLGSAEEGSVLARQYYSTLNYVTTQLPKLLYILKNASTEDEIAGNNSDKTSELTKFSVVAAEDSDGLVTPSRLVDLIESTQLLYEVAATLNGSLSTQLKIAAADSGSDIVLTFQGATGAVCCLLTFFTAIYRVLMFYPEKKQVERAKAIADTLEVASGIGQKEQEGLITPEVAGRLRHDLGVGADRHISAHAYVPQADSAGIPSLRLLVAPETKLLTAPVNGESEINSHDKQEPNAAADVTEKLSSEENKTLQELLRKMNAGNEDNTSINSDNDGTDNPEPFSVPTYF